VELKHHFQLNLDFIKSLILIIKLKKRFFLDSYIVKIVTNDQKGLIYKISEVIYNSGLNIEKNREFVDIENGKFFFRARINGEVDRKKLISELLTILPNAKIEVLQKRKKEIVVMATKESHAIGDILIKHYSNEIDANIVAVISNHNSLRDLVEKFGIKYHYISHENLNRIEHEKLVLELLDSYSFDYIVLAKYMRILSSSFVENFEEKIINIHHSFLPAFIGANPYKQAHQRGVKIIGATAHFVNNNLDEGPIIAQDVIPVNHNFSWRDMQKAGRDVESNVLSKAMDLVFNDRIFVYSNKTIIF